MLSGIDDHSRFVVSAAVLAVLSGRAVADAFTVPMKAIIDGMALVGGSAGPDTHRIPAKRRARNSLVLPFLGPRWPGPVVSESTGSAMADIGLGYLIAIALPGEPTAPGMLSGTATKKDV
jgi:hypothetical protein